MLCSAIRQICSLLLIVGEVSSCFLGRHDSTDIIVAWEDKCHNHKLFVIPYSSLFLPYSYLILTLFLLPQSFHYWHRSIDLCFQYFLLTTGTITVVVGWVPVPAMLSLDAGALFPVPSKECFPLFLKGVSPELPPSWLMGPEVSCGGPCPCSPTQLPCGHR